MSISIPLRPGKLLQTAMHELETGSPSKSHKRRWRLAFMAISFTRALRFLAKNVHENKAILLRSLSYVAIDVQPSADADDKPAGNVDPKDLADIVRAKNLGALMSQYGGLERLVKTLETDVKNGINSTESDLMRRKNIFGANEYQKQPVKGFLPSVFDALLKIVIIVVLGMKQPGSQDQGWFDVDGMSIILVVSILLAFSAASNFRRSRALAQKLSRNSSSSSDMSVNVTRNGQALTISIFDVVVGDVVNLKIGDQIPADGLFSEGHSLKVDESCLTGESDHVEINAASNPFMLSGTKVVGGAGTMVVTSVGMNTAWGEKMSSVVLCGDDDEVTPLQTRLKQLTSFIQKVGLYVTALILVSSMVCYIIRHKTVENGCGQKEYGVGSSKNKFDDVINSVVGIVAAAMAIIVVGIPDGLHLAVTLTEVYSMRRMMKDYAVVRNLTACETMGSTTMVCITLNEMKVTEVWLGKEPLYEDGTIISLLRESIGLNTAGGVYKPTPDTTPEKSGSPIDKAMMSWAVFSLGLDIDELKARCEIIQVEASNSEKKMSGVLFRRKHKRTLHECHWKGAAEIVLAKCSNYYDRDGVIRPINKEERKCIETNIQNMAAKGLRCIAFAHKKIEREQGQINSEKMEESGLTLLALAGLTNPCGPGVKVVVDTCIAAGVGIKMVTDDDNVHTARAMAVECGILKPEHDDVLESREAVIEGVQFRNLSPEEEKRKVEKIRVMARSSPFDKRLMVESLKRKSDPHVVAFIGDGRNDAPALKEAHVGISMGLFQGPEVANEISDILILNDNINSVVTILKWGSPIDCCPAFVGEPYHGHICSFSISH
ncbi:calcium-transporting ATPase 12, plasma membrane-type-like isoform X2 [Humulus lupulus]|uniref:calcium-transporting ATPase 12, plasma membrane-type-like isoform X2 n=1 Tax=Humulus lupulus TaxID=3486 RepID=UPI002B40EF83|nr:calcium-transporting ATPase 12, plasma membrane-type-like isoform X2 [Humulus lupulus]